MVRKCFILLFVFFSAAIASELSDGKTQNVYVAPVGCGNATGLTIENAASYTRVDIWKKVNRLLEDGPVTVWLADGHYSNDSLILRGIGNDKHILIIKGQSQGRVVFNAQVGNMVGLEGCRNIVLENLNFTGLITGYALRITKKCEGKINKDAPRSVAKQIKDAPGEVSKNIIVRNCNWYDMEKLYYGATSKGWEGSIDISDILKIEPHSGSDI